MLNAAVEIKTTAIPAKSYHISFSPRKRPPEIIAITDVRLLNNPTVVALILLTAYVRRIDVITDDNIPKYNIGNKNVFSANGAK